MSSMELQYNAHREIVLGKKGMREGLLGYLMGTIKSENPTNKEERNRKGLRPAAR